LAIAYWLRGDRAMSDESFAQSIELGRALHEQFPDSPEITRATGEAMYRRSTLSQMSGDYDEAITDTRAALALFDSLPNARINSYVRHRTIGAKTTLGVCMAAQGDEKGMTDFLGDALASARQMVLSDPDDQAAFRHICLNFQFASDGYRLLAARPEISEDDRLRLLLLARASMVEAHNLTIERDKRGWLPFWEQRYLAEQEAILADLDRQIETIADRATLMEPSLPGR